MEHDPIPTPAVPRRDTRSGKRRKRRRNPLLALWQIIVLAALAALVLWAALSLSEANRSMAALRRERAEKALAWQQEVARHQTLYRQEIIQYSARNRIDPAFTAAIIKRESDYDPKAVSRVGAMGLMQMMPDSFDWIGPKCGLDKNDKNALFIPENAIRTGCYLLGYIAPMFDGDPILTACAYHAGWGNVKGWLQKYSADGKHLTLDEIPMEDTRYYARKVLEAYAIYQQYHY